MKMKRFLITPAVLAGVVLLAEGIVVTPVHAQVRPALVRDQDNPALAPVTASTTLVLIPINTQQVLMTVPAGKRLVIEHVSYFASGDASDQLIYLSLRVGSLGEVVHVFQINPPHTAFISGTTIQDGGTPIKAYFEAGQDVVVSASHTSNVPRQVQVFVTGYYITP